MSSEDRRINCETCETRKEQKGILAKLNKITGANTVRNWLLGVVVVGVLFGSLYDKATADSISELITRVALTEQAIEEIQKNAAEEKKHREKHRAQHEEDQKQLLAKQDEILKAVKER